MTHEFSEAEGLMFPEFANPDFHRARQEASWMRLKRNQRKIFKFGGSTWTELSGGEGDEDGGFLVDGGLVVLPNPDAISDRFCSNNGWPLLKYGSPLASCAWYAAGQQVLLSETLRGWASLPHGTSDWRARTYSEDAVLTIDYWHGHLHGAIRTSQKAVDELIGSIAPVWQTPGSARVPRVWKWFEWKMHSGWWFLDEQVIDETDFNDKCKEWRAAAAEQMNSTGLPGGVARIVAGYLM